MPFLFKAVSDPTENFAVSEPYNPPIDGSVPNKTRPIFRLTGFGMLGQGLRKVSSSLSRYFGFPSNDPIQTLTKKKNKKIRREYKNMNIILQQLS